MVEDLSLIRLAIAIVLMSYAAISDWKTRKAANWIWMVMGGLGMILLAYELSFSDIFAGVTLNTMGDSIMNTRSFYKPVFFLIFIPIGIFFYDVFWDRELVYHQGKFNLLPIILYAIGFIAMALLVYYEGFTEATMTLLTIPIMLT